MGCTDCDYVEKFGGRVETFDIADDEQLIGCELDQDCDFFNSVKWMKMKMPQIKESLHKKRLCLLF